MHRRPRMTRAIDHTVSPASTATGWTFRDVLPNLCRPDRTLRIIIDPLSDLLKFA